MKEKMISISKFLTQKITKESFKDEKVKRSIKLVICGAIILSLVFQLVNCISIKANAWEYGFQVTYVDQLPLDNIRTDTIYVLTPDSIVEGTWIMNDTVVKPEGYGTIAYGSSTLSISTYARNSWGNDYSLGLYSSNYTFQIRGAGSSSSDGFYWAHLESGSYPIVNKYWYGSYYTCEYRPGSDYVYDSTTFDGATYPNVRYLIINSCTETGDRLARLYEWLTLNGVRNGGSDDGSVSYNIYRNGTWDVYSTLDDAMSSGLVGGETEEFTATVNVQGDFNENTQFELIYDGGSVSLNSSNTLPYTIDLSYSAMTPLYDSELEKYYYELSVTTDGYIPYMKFYRSDGSYIQTIYFGDDTSDIITLDTNQTVDVYIEQSSSPYELDNYTRRIYLPKYDIDAAWREGYDLGYDQGYDAGNNVGYNQGLNQGKQEGYEEGYEDGEYIGYSKGTSDELVRGFFGNMLGGIIDALDSIRFYEETISDNNTPSDTSDDVTFHISVWTILCSIVILGFILALLKVWRGN